MIDPDVEYKHRFARSFDTGPRVEVLCSDESHDEAELVELFKRVDFRGDQYWLATLGYSTAMDNEYIVVGGKSFKLRPDMYHGENDDPWG